MPDFKIVGVSQVSHCLVVRVEHYHPDGSLWFIENYRFQGREGLKHKRDTDAEGFILMDDGNRAPLRAVPNLPSTMAEYLPAERGWARKTETHMDENSILDTIRSIHAQRLVSGWPQGAVDVLSQSTSAIQRDVDGCSALMARFTALIGREGP